MNAFETWFCGSGFWRYVTRRELLPWILQGSTLGEHVLELGAGLGAATEELARTWQGARLVLSTTTHLQQSSVQGRMVRMPR